MFLSASIAFTFLAAPAVRSAPLVSRAAGPLACTDVNGGGSCFPVLASPPGVNTGECNNLIGVKSLVLSDANECLTYLFPDCQLGPDANNIVVVDLIASSNLNLPGDVKSVECFI
ncbi:hypothetical protein DFH09DRAFT_1325142 [Mycena vulgaris]|nr:hypothetical protein DFH09DRAFT_1325142 [Mycena vulgaris]